MDMRRTIALISCPTLVIAGQYDTVTLPSHSEWIATTVPGAKLVVLPVVHLSNLGSSGGFHEQRFGLSDLNTRSNPAVSVVK